MALTDQLREILPEVLPSDPGSSLFGPELLKLVREKLVGDYADNTLRTTFSVLAADPTSPIARVEEGFGYYRRPSAQQSPPISDNASIAVPDLGPIPDSNAKSFQLEERFRAFYLRHSALLNRFPMHVEHLSAQRKSAGVNKWKFPDVLVLDWDAGESGDTGFVLDRSLLEVKRSLGEQPFRVTSVELKVELSLASFREHFFQCVSNSMCVFGAGSRVRGFESTRRQHLER